MTRRPARTATRSDAGARESHVALGLLLAAAFVVKLVVFVELGDHPLLQAHGDLDTTYYVDLARQIADGGVLAVREPFFVSPLYVYFLAVIFGLGGSLAAAGFVQVLLGTGAVGLMYLTTRQWFGSRAAWIAGLLYILTGLVTFYEVLILQAALDPFLVACALYFISRAQRDARRWSILAAGVSVGLLVLNRPNALAYAAVAAVLIAGQGWRSSASGGRPAAGTAIGRGAVFLAGVALVLAPNALRNYAASGEAILISSHGGLNFYIGNNASATGTYVPVPGVTASVAGQARDATRVAEAAVGRRLSSGEVSQYFVERAWEWIASHPGSAARLFARKMVYVLNRVDVPLNYSYAYYSRDEPTLLRALAVGAWLLVPLGLVGLFLPAARQGRRGFWVWGSFVPVYALSVALFFVSDRYRLPLFIPLATTSAATLTWLAARLRGVSREGPGPFFGLTALVALAALVNWNFGLDDGRGGEQTRKAVWLVEQGEYEAARQYVQRVAPDHSHPGVLQFQVGRALAKAGRYDEAVEAFRRALDIDRGQPAIQLELGQALLLTRRADEAVTHLTTAFDAGFRPEMSGPWLVRALAAAGRQRDAVSRLAALPDALADSGPDAAIDLGSLALELNAPAEAERWLRAAVARQPARPEAQEQLGAALLLLGRPGQAILPLETACRLNPSGASAHLNLAVAYAALGRAADARAQAEEAVRLDPSEPRAQKLLKALSRTTRR